MLTVSNIEEETSDGFSPDLIASLLDNYFPSSVPESNARIEVMDQGKSASQHLVELNQRCCRAMQSGQMAMQSGLESTTVVPSTSTTSEVHSSTSTGPEKTPVPSTTVDVQQDEIIAIKVKPTKAVKPKAKPKPKAKVSETTTGRKRKAPAVKAAQSKKNKKKPDGDNLPVVTPSTSKSSSASESSDDASSSPSSSESDVAKVVVDESASSLPQSVTTKESVPESLWRKGTKSVSLLTDLQKKFWNYGHSLFNTQQNVMAAYDLAYPLQMNHGFLLEEKIRVQTCFAKFLQSFLDHSAAWRDLRIALQSNILPPPACVSEFSHPLQSYSAKRIENAHDRVFLQRGHISAQDQPTLSSDLRRHDESMHRKILADFNKQFNVKAQTVDKGKHYSVQVMNIMADNNLIPFKEDEGYDAFFDNLAKLDKQLKYRLLTYVMYFAMEYCKIQAGNDAEVRLALYTNMVNRMVNDFPERVSTLPLEKVMARNTTTKY